MCEAGRYFLAAVFRAYAGFPDFGDEWCEFFVYFDVADCDEFMVCDGGELRLSVDDAFCDWVSP